VDISFATPPEALVSEDKDGSTWIGDNDLKYLAVRHETECAPVVENMGKAMRSFIQAAVTQSTNGLKIRIQLIALSPN
jgi:hypothetical protein